MTEGYERGKLDGQILQELKDVNEHLVEIKDAVKGHEKRIRALEGWRWWTLGASVTVGVGAAKITSAMLL